MVLSMAFLGLCAPLSRSASVRHPNRSNKYVGPVTEITLQRIRGFEIDRPYLEYTLTVSSSGAATIISRYDPVGTFSAHIPQDQFKKLARDVVASGFFMFPRSSDVQGVDSATYYLSSVRSGKRKLVFDGFLGGEDLESRRLRTLEAEIEGLTTRLHWVKTGSSTEQPRF